MTIKENCDEVLATVAEAAVAAHRPLESIHLVAVTKYVDSSLAKKIVESGLNHLGENRVDKFLEKYEALSDLDVAWHFIGSLQRRKVKNVINLIDYFHALDSVKLAQEIEKRAEKIIPCFLQVNLSREESKHGFLLEEIEDALVEIQKLKHIRLVGLMTMAPRSANQEELDNLFSRTDALRKELAGRQIENMPFTELSMGMSGDYPLAIAHGATFVRVGSALFK